MFKSRYLDYYVFITDDSVDKKTIEEPIKELKKEKDIYKCALSIKLINLNLLIQMFEKYLF